MTDNIFKDWGDQIVAEIATRTADITRLRDELVAAREDEAKVNAEWRELNKRVERMLGEKGELVGPLVMRLRWEEPPKLSKADGIAALIVGQETLIVELREALDQIDRILNPAPGWLEGDEFWTPPPPPALPDVPDNIVMGRTA